MRRLFIGILGIVLLGAALAAPRAQAATPTVSQWVRIFHQQVDLTDGGVTEVMRIGGSGSASLRLIGVSLTGVSAGAKRFVSWPTSTYGADAHPVTKLSGDRTSGIWRVRMMLTRWVPADTYRVAVLWRVGQDRVWKQSTRSVTVVNPNGDVQSPTLVWLRSPLEDQEVPQSTGAVASFRLSDDRSGVGLVWLCYVSASDPYGEQPCDEAKRVSGTNLDGVWAAHLDQLSLLPTGPAAVRVEVWDHMQNDSTWYPADEPMLGGGSGGPFPGGRGDFTIVP
ncbi:hypothetical protein GCM10028801_42720 [Nocardioides maradonensis]